MLKTISPEGWAPAKGYANGMLSESGALHIGGQIGWDENQQFQTDDFVGQLEQTLRNIRAIVEAAGGEVSDIARLTWYLKGSKSEYLSRLPEVGAAYRAVMGRHFPAMAVVVVSDLMEDRALIEIEATAQIDRA
jgi:enamine deaminase RidA (YjgF/YER057c/UK114 family)